jgi:hypothetical protein
MACWEKYPASERGGCVYWSEIERRQQREEEKEQR